MTAHQFPLAVVVLAVLTVGVCAQQTWIVDQNNGPGTNFTDLPPAIAVAQSGDRILLRNGGYTGGIIERGITLMAEPGATPLLAPPSNSVETLLVRFLPASETVVIQGIRNQGALPPLTPPLPTRFLAIRNNSGRVHLADLSISLSEASPSGNNDRVGVSILNSPHVTLHASTIQECTTVVAWGSTLAITDSTLRGVQGQSFPGGNFTASRLGCRLTGSTTVIAGTTVIGGGEVNLRPVTAQPAIELNGGSLRITGTSSNRIAGGAGTIFGVTYAISGTGGAIEVDPRVALVATQSTPIAPGHTVQTESIPALSVDGAPPGGTVVVDLRADSGDVAAIYLSAPFGPAAGPANWGSLWLDLTGTLQLGQFAVPGSEHVGSSFGIANNPILQGLPVTFQALVLRSAGGFRFSAPCTSVMN